MSCGLPSYQVFNPNDSGLSQGYKISWSVLLPPHRACHFLIHPLRVKRILPPLMGLCMLSRTINPSLVLSALVVPHEYFLIMPYLLVFLSIQNWLFSKPSLGASSSKKTPWPLRRAQNPENSVPAPVLIQFPLDMFTLRGKTVLPALVICQREQGLGKNFFFFINVKLKIRMYFFKIQFRYPTVIKCPQWKWTKHFPFVQEAMWQGILKTFNSVSQDFSSLGDSYLRSRSLKHLTKVCFQLHLLSTTVKDTR